MSEDLKNRTSRYKPIIIAAVIGAGLLGIDVGSKYLVNLLLIHHVEVKTFLPNLSFWLTYNEGYHYILGEIGNYTVFNIFALAMAAVVVVFIVRSALDPKNDPVTQRLYLVILSLLTGALANPLEALFTGRVTDWFIFRPFPWPSNIADQYVNILIFIIMPLLIVREFKKGRKSKTGETDETNQDQASVPE